MLDARYSTGVIASEAIFAVSSAEITTACKAGLAMTTVSSNEYRSAVAFHGCGCEARIGCVNPPQAD